ncbi:MAG: hypothetical protein U0R69_01050 [Gaiellales bacterium]
MFHLWHQNHGGIGGHVFLLDEQMRDLREELTAQGMVCGREGGRGIPLHKLETPGDHFVSPVELDEALDVASGEPAAIADERLWRDFLAFLEGAAHRGGLRIK